MIICEHGTRPDDKVCDICDAVEYLDARHQMVWAAAFVAAVGKVSVERAWREADLITSAYTGQGVVVLRAVIESSEMSGNRLVKR